MYIHIGGDITLPSDKIIGIFDIEKTSVNKDVNDYLMKLQKQGRIWENEAQIDTGSEAGIDLLDTGLADTARLDELARLLLSLELQEALAQLGTEQRRILLLLFIDDLKPKEVAGRLSCSVRNITKHRLKALDRLRQLLTN